MHRRNGFSHVFHSRWFTTAYFEANLEKVQVCTRVEKFACEDPHG